MLKPITLDGIQCGGLMEIANGKLAEISEDVVKRAHLTEGRKLIITVEIKPELKAVAPDKTVNKPSIDWKVEYRVPGEKGMTTRAFVQDGKVKVDADDPMNGDPAEPTIFNVSSKAANN